MSLASLKFQPCPWARESKPEYLLARFMLFPCHTLHAGGHRPQVTLPATGTISGARSIRPSKSKNLTLAGVQDDSVHSGRRAQCIDTSPIIFPRAHRHAHKQAPFGVHARGALSLALAAPLGIRPLSPPSPGEAHFLNPPQKRGDYLERKLSKAYSCAFGACFRRVPSCYTRHSRGKTP